MIRTLIVDDEAIARDGVRSILAEEPDIDVVGECGDGRSAVTAIQSVIPDLVLLDVQMPRMDGFAVLDALEPGRRPVVIFLTAHDQYALRAFDAQALDYVVKPFSDARLRSAVDRARNQVEQRRRLRAAPPETPSTRYLVRIPVRSLGKTTYVEVRDIVWIGASDYYAELHTRDRRRHLVRETMQHLEQGLDPALFCRIHRSAIVRIDSVVELRRGHVVLRDGTRLLLGRHRRGALEMALGDTHEA
jgi:two-component system LytT family response regulator